jgi:acyl-coenzyme A thioesterase PaaI-like protein
MTWSQTPAEGPPRPRQARQRAVAAALAEDPFLTDEALAARFGVSVPTVRLDRLTLGIPELRQRTQAVAKKNLPLVRTLRSDEIVGSILDLEIGVRALSLLETTPEMGFQRSGVLPGQLVYGQAETAALALAEAAGASVELVNVKFKRPVRAGERLVAKAEVLRRRPDGAMVVLVVSRSGEETVCRAKFVVTAAEVAP